MGENVSRTHLVFAPSEAVTPKLLKALRPGDMRVVTLLQRTVDQVHLYEYVFFETYKIP